MEDISMMISSKVAAIAGGSAIAGGVAAFLAEGDYKFQLFVQRIVGAMFGWCFVVAISVLYPQIVGDPWIFAAMTFLAAWVCPALLKAVFHRIETVEIHVKAGIVEVHSD